MNGFSYYVAKAEKTGFDVWIGVCSGNYGKNRKNCKNKEESYKGMTKKKTLKISKRFFLLIFLR